MVETSRYINALVAEYRPYKPSATTKAALAELAGVSTLAQLKALPGCEQHPRLTCA